MATINGTISCVDSPHLCTVQTYLSGHANIYDSTDLFNAYGFVISQTLSLASDGTFYQGQLLTDQTGLFLTLTDSTLLGFNTVDGTYIDATRRFRTYDPVWINYGIYYLPDNTRQLGYRFRTPMNPQVGQYYANMEAPDTVGPHRIQWLYRKDASSYATAVNQDFYVDHWGNKQGYDATGWPSYTTVTVLPTYQFVMLNETVSFIAYVTGPLPSPLTYQWRKFGTNLTDGGHYSGTQTNTLTISNTAPEDYASYDCIVSAAFLSNTVWLSVDPP